MQVSTYQVKLLYSIYTRIMEFDFDTRNATVLLKLGRTNVYAIDYDYQNRYIYFPRFYYNDIVRFPYPSNNTALQTVVQSLSNPTGIAVDSANDHLYWIVSGGQLSRCNLDGRNATVLSTLSILDTEENRLYWINTDSEMKSCKDDGSDVKIILSTHVRTYYFAISVVGSYIYYGYDHQLLMVNKSQGSKPTVLYNDTSRIDSIFVFNSK
ncbi:Hypothetical predicted protein, partial [Mytilus galloprovincialis]